MEKVLIGYDDNLGMPKDFAETVECEVVPYHILTPMIEDYMKGELAALFIPAGTLPYMKDDLIFSQSLFGSDLKTTLRTNFVTTRNITIEEIAKQTIGRVNQYCTTSFWAPLIYLSQFYQANTEFKFQNTNGFLDMLEKTASNKIGCAMVWDIFIENNPDLARKIHQLFFKDDLPTPVIVGKNDFPKELIERINQFKTKDEQTFFKGFQKPDLTAIKKFQKDMQHASEYFNIPIMTKQTV